MVVTGDGKPIEVHFMPGAENDLNVLWKMELDIPIGSELYADGAYNCFDHQPGILEGRLLKRV